MSTKQTSSDVMSQQRRRLQRLAWRYFPKKRVYTVDNGASVHVSQEKFWIFCEGCDIVQSDHAPQAGVAQGIFHGDLIRHQGGHQEELEEELEEEVERRVRRGHSSNQTQVRTHG